MSLYCPWMRQDVTPPLPNNPQRDITKGVLSIAISNVPISLTLAIREKNSQIHCTVLKLHRIKEKCRKTYFTKFHIAVLICCSVILSFI